MIDDNYDSYFGLVTVVVTPYRSRHPALRSKSQKPIRVGVDTGGTFTDFVFETKDGLQIFKLPSTPDDPSLAIWQGLKRIAKAVGSSLSKIEVIHGTTVGTNAILQGRGAKTALITTRGFEDILVIGRQARPELYNLNATKPPPLVAESLRLGVGERTSANGDVLEPLSETDLTRLVARLERSKVEAVAISLLFSFANPEHELRIAEALSSFSVPLSISHQILPEYREYERTSTVTINAYLQPLMGEYLRRLERQAPRLRVMQSSGGSISAVVAAAEPVRTILSGPAGGVVGALKTATAAGFKTIITFDMGGTSTDVALCDRAEMRTTNEAMVSDLPIAIPVMDIHTVGAGGGSIARVDEGGSLRVGPESAGADPGPACYGRSLLPTVTDAHLVLGHFGGAGLLGGEFLLVEERAQQAMSVLARALSAVAGREISYKEAAQSVVTVVNTNMERALRRISVERGFDPREFILFPFGGAGGLHAVELARGLQIPKVLSPRSGGALSAIGVLAADVVKDQSRTVMLKLKPGVENKLERVFSELQRTALSALKREGFVPERQQHEQALAMRYKGQSFELEIKPTKRELAESFHQAHLLRYGYKQEENEIEIVSVRLRSSGLVQQLKPRRIRVLKAPERAKYARVYFAGEQLKTKILQRDSLPAGTRLKGPCILVEYSATTLIPPGASGSIDAYGNLLIEV